MGTTAVCVFGLFLLLPGVAWDMLSPSTQSEPDDTSHDQSHPRSAVDEPTEAVAIHNYDHWSGHSVEVTVATAEGETVVRERHYLPPDQSVRMSGAVEAGEYHLRVMVDGVERSRTVHQLDDTHAGTAVVELGNGVVSVTDDAPTLYLGR